MRALRAAREASSLPLGRAAAAFQHTGAWAPFGFARLADYTRERLGRSSRWLRDLARLDDAVLRFPALGVALVGGDGCKPLGRVAALVVGRIATHDSLPFWIERARTMSVRELKEAAREAAATDPEDPARCAVRITAVPFVLALFDEALDLFRTVEGGEATVTSFVEALVAESASESPLSDIPISRLRKGATEAERERACMQAPDTTAVELDQTVQRTLARIRDVARRAGTGGPAELDEQLRALVQFEDSIEQLLGPLLAILAARRGWQQLGFASLAHYAEERLGIGRSTAEDRVRAARSVERWAEAATAYRNGEIGMQATLLLDRILRGHGRSHEQAWVAHARTLTVKRLRDELRILEREACKRGPADDAHWHASLHRHAGTAIERLTHWTGAWMENPVRIPNVFLALRLPEDVAHDFVSAVESWRRRVHGVPCSERIAHAFSGAVPPWVGLVALLEHFIRTWDRAPRRAGDRLYERDGWRCSAPGCTSRRNLEDHHINYRSRGGSHAMQNRICLCRFHHRLGEHGAFARCRGQAPTGVLWRLGRIDLATWYRNERRISANGGRLRRSRRGA